MNTDNTTLPLRFYPDSILRQKCEPIVRVDDDIVLLARQMRATMITEQGVGLAAPQVGKRLRLFVADVSDKQNQPLVIINPVIRHTEGEITFQEGCLSVPDVRASVNRARAITVSGLSLAEEEITINAEDFLAVCIQHEIDHLDGILFFDHITMLKRGRLLQKYKKERAQADS